MKTSTPAEKHDPNAYDFDTQAISRRATSKKIAGTSFAIGYVSNEFVRVAYEKRGFLARNASKRRYMDSERKKILYVDDDEASLDMMTNWISSNEESFDVATVDSVHAALDAVGRCSYDLFLLDDFLGTGSGVGLCREIRALGSKKPVIIYSGQVSQENFESAKAAGVNGYLVKPDDLDMLVPAIRRVLGLRPRVFADKIRPRLMQAIL